MINYNAANARIEHFAKRSKQLQNQLFVSKKM